MNIEAKTSKPSDIVIHLTIDEATHLHSYLKFNMDARMVDEFLNGLQTAIVSSVVKARSS